MPPQDNPAFARGKEISINRFDKLSCSYHHLTRRTISDMSSSTTSARINEESLRIQAWLSPLEPHKRHQDVRNRRLAGVGDWILQKNEFGSWRRDGSANPTLQCYGDQGVGKTYIRYCIRVPVFSGDRRRC